MIKFLYGPDAAKKTAVIMSALSEDAKNGKPSVLIVPDQQALDAERMTLNALPPEAQLTLEVLGFSRLYNRVCREYGGLSFSYMTNPVKHLMMWQALQNAAPILSRYADNASEDSAFVSTMLGAISELKFSGVGLSELEDTLSAIEDEELGSRISDICIIWTEYEALISERYTDSADDLSRLCDAIEEHDFFAGKNVYVDSFTSFTAVEHRIIDRIFATADNVTVSVALPYPKYSDLSTQSITASADTLKKHALRWSEPQYVSVPDSAVQCAPLRYLRDNLWNMSVSEVHKPSAEGCITIDVCNTSYSEADAVACRILELLRGGARCNEIVIVTRNAEQYRGIIEPALDRGNIPYYFSEKSDVCSLPPVKLILSALRIRKYNWRRNDVISHIKTGLCSFSMRSADLFEEYVNTWNISGKQFTEGEWTMNPDGFADRISERGEEILKEARELRAALVEPLQRLFIELDMASSARDACYAIYKYTCDIELEDKLLAISERERKKGELKSAEEYASAYGIILGALGDTAVALGDKEISIDDLGDILKKVFSETEVGTIPTSVDEVLIGSASTLRSTSPKYVFVMGLCEGEFPQNVTDDGIFTDADKNALSELGISLGETVDTRASDELMYAKKAFSLATERLFLFTSASTIDGKERAPSLPLTRVSALFSDVPTRRFSGEDVFASCGSPRLAAAHLRSIKDESVRQSVINAVSPHVPAFSSLSLAPVTANECRLDPELIRELIGDTIDVSPTGIDKYVRCPFSYFVGYMLGLREQKRGVFKSNDFGSFLHFMLEHLIRFCVPTDKESTPPTREQIDAKIDEVADEYVRRICPPDLFDNKRLAHLYAKLRRLSRLLINNILDELADGDFRPSFFELNINGAAGNPEPLILKLDNGAQIRLGGKIDRVDMWRHGEDVYVRIVDYKSGHKSFSLADVREGANTQMLLYLFTLCSAPGARVTAEAGIGKDGRVLPAGITYLSSAVSSIKVSDLSVSEDEILATAANSLSRTGLLLDDPDLLDAISHSQRSSLLLGASREKGGKSLISAEELSALEGEIRDTLISIAERIYAGVADCQPKSIGGSDPCKYCTAKPLCRRVNKNGGAYDA